MKNTLIINWDIVKLHKNDILISLNSKKINSKNEIIKEIIINRILKLKNSNKINNVNIFLYNQVNSTIEDLIKEISNFTRNVIIFFDPTSVSNLIIDTLVSIGIKDFVFPFDSPSPIIYDFIWQKKNSFDIIWQAIDHISYNYLKKTNIIFTCSISKVNLNDIVPTLGWCVNFGVAKIRFRPIQPSPLLTLDKWYDSQYYKSLWIDNFVKLKKILEYLKHESIKYSDIILNESNDFDEMLTYFENQIKWQTVHKNKKYNNYIINPENQVIEL